MTFQGIVGNADQKDGENPGSSAGTEGENQNSQAGEERTVPYARFQKVNAKAKELESKYESLEKQIADLKAASNPKSEDFDPSMDFDKAMKKIRDEAADIALQKLRAEQDSKSVAQRK
jgi:predicted transcriptional regulator